MLASRQRIAGQEHLYISPRNVRPFDTFNMDQDLGALPMLGINLTPPPPRYMNAMDAIQPTVTTASMNVPVQFLQNWLAGFVFVTTQARNIDKLIGIMTTGDWSDAEVVQGILERVGYPQPYGDTTNVPLSSWNVNWNYRNVVRFEEGYQTGQLESAQSARMGVDSGSAKREAAVEALEILRNQIGFNGYNSGLNLTYGFLNDPGLPAYTNVPNGAASSPLWANKTFLEICKDIRVAIATLRNQSGDRIDPASLKMTLAVATASVDYLSTTSDQGVSVTAWLNKAYPNIRVVSAPELSAANGSANVFYLYAETVSDKSTDGGRVFIQPVPAKFQVLGVQQKVKSYEEDYTNATAGVMCKRPWAVVRRSGI